MKHGERLAPQRGNMPVGAQTRIAMSMGAEMAMACSRSSLWLSGVPLERTRMGRLRRGPYVHRRVRHSHRLRRCVSRRKLHGGFVFEVFEGLASLRWRMWVPMRGGRMKTREQYVGYCCSPE